MKLVVVCLFAILDAAVSSFFRPVPGLDGFWERECGTRKGSFELLKEHHKGNREQLVSALKYGVCDSFTNVPGMGEAYICRGKLASEVYTANMMCYNKQGTGTTCACVEAQQRSQAPRNPSPVLADAVPNVVNNVERGRDGSVHGSSDIRLDTAVQGDAAPRRNSELASDASGAAGVRTVFSTMPVGGKERHNNPGAVSQGAAGVESDPTFEPRTSPKVTDNGSVVGTSPSLPPAASTSSELPTYSPQSSESKSNAAAGGSGGGTKSGHVKEPTEELQNSAPNDTSQVGENSTDSSDQKQQEDGEDSRRVPQESSSVKGTASSTNVIHVTIATLHIIQLLFFYLFERF